MYVCICVHMHTSPGGDLVYCCHIKADVDGTNQEMKPVVLVSALVTFL